jgi:hypothetical protein
MVEPDYAAISDVIRRDVVIGAVGGIPAAAERAERSGVEPQAVATHLRPEDRRNRVGNRSGLYKAVEHALARHERGRIPGRFPRWRLARPHPRATGRTVRIPAAGLYRSAVR